MVALSVVPLPAPAACAPLIMEMDRPFISVRSAKNSGLTGRELQILGLLQRGFTTKQIGGQLALQDATVRGYIREICGKLGVDGGRLGLGLWIARNLSDDGAIPPLPLIPQNGQ